MPVLKIFQNRRTSDVVLCQYAHNSYVGGGGTPIGCLIKLTRAQFLSIGADRAQVLMDEFFRRSHTVPSELYDEMTDEERASFLADHEQLILSADGETGATRVYVGQNAQFFGELPYPLSKESFAKDVLAILAGKGDITDIDGVR